MWQDMISSDDKRWRASVLRRLSEPSTYAGLAVLAALFGVSAEDWQQYSNALAAIFAIVAMVARESGTRK